MAIKFLLFDIEGTTTDIAFVHDVLFPYALERIQQYVTAHAHDPMVRDCIAQVEKSIEETGAKAISADEAIQILKSWIEADKKHPALKTLQGLIWEEGFKTGAFKGHVYPEVPDCLRRWEQNGLRLGIYSSGSVQAQKLLFGYSEYGDLTPLFDAHFDTAVGGKKETASYRNIAQQLVLTPEEVLFVSDVGDELAAAQSVGFQVIQSVRPNIQPDDRFPQIQNFSQLNVGSSPAKSRC